MVPLEACEPYFEYMRRTVEVDSDLMHLVASHITEVTYPAKHIILQQGGVSNKGVFVVSGTARSYYIDASGVTVTWSFHFNNEKSIGRNLWAFDYRAFLTNKPSLTAVETISEVKALIFEREQVNNMMEKSLKYEVFMRKLNANAYLGMYDRAFTLLTMSATERYQKLLSEEPYLLQLFSNYYIASYLGIAPQSLSRIRSQH